LSGTEDAASPDEPLLVDFLAGALQAAAPDTTSAAAATTQATRDK
jgi:hypothetical protein